jgi:acyl dehydratase
MSQSQVGETEAGFPDRVLAPVEAGTLRAYAEASGDPNPIHLDEAVAKQMGLPGIIAHGMWVASVLTSHVQVTFGSGARLSRMNYRFKGMVVLGEALTLTLRWRPDRDSPEGRAFEAQARKPDGSVACIAQGELHRSF